MLLSNDCQVVHIWKQFRQRHSAFLVTVYPTHSTEEEVRGEDGDETEQSYSKASLFAGCCQPCHTGVHHAHHAEQRSCLESQSASPLGLFLKTIIRTEPSGSNLLLLWLGPGLSPSKAMLKLNYQCDSVESW